MRQKTRVELAQELQELSISSKREILAMRNTIEAKKDIERYLRKQLTEVMANQQVGLDFSPGAVNYMGSNVSLTWEQIFFEVGKLKSQTEYTILKDQNKQLTQIIAQLDEKIDKIQIK